MSPLYNVNPSIYGNTLSLNMDSCDNAIRYGLALETAGYYGIEINDAKNTIADIRKIVSENWRELAPNYKLLLTAETDILRQNIVVL